MQSFQILVYLFFLGWYGRMPMKSCQILLILFRKNSAKSSAVSLLVLPGGSRLSMFDHLSLLTILNNSLVFLPLSMICLVITCLLCYGILAAFCTDFFQWCRLSNDALLYDFCTFYPCFWQFSFVCKYSYWTWICVVCLHTSHFLECCSVKHFVQYLTELIACLFETSITINDLWGVVLFQVFPCQLSEYSRLFLQWFPKVLFECGVNCY